MRATKLTLKNVLGFEDAEINLGGITVITGENASGKTSLIEALVGLFGSGHDATLLRTGSEQGQIVLELDEGTIQKTITETETDPSVRLKGAGRVSSPVKYMRKIADLLALNPVDFARAKTDKERIKWLEEFLPLELDRAALAKATPSLALRPEDFEGNALEVLSRLRTRVYDARTGANRTRDDKIRAVRELEASLPPDDGTDQTAKLAALENNRRELEARLDFLKTNSRTRLVGCRENLRLVTQNLRHQYEREAETKIEAARTELAEKLKSLHLRSETELQKANDTAAELLARDGAPINEELQRLAAEIGQTQEQVQQQVRAVTLRKVKERTEAEAQAAAAESVQLTTALERLNGLKRDLLQNLPFPGLEIADGQILLDGVPFNRVNTGRKWNFALNFAVHRLETLLPDGLKLICVDGAECLDAKNFATLEAGVAKLAERGYQFIITRVTDDPLKIETR